MADIQTNFDNVKSFAATAAEYNIAPYNGANVTSMTDFGLDFGNFNLLKNDVESVIEKATDLVNGFNQDNSYWNQALKGKVKQEGIKYMNEVKQLVISFTGELRELLSVANQAVNLRSEADTTQQASIADNVGDLAAVSKNIDNETADMLLNIDDLASQYNQYDN